VPRFVLISILECDKAPNVPHFHQKYVTELYLAEKKQPYLALRAGAFLDRARTWWQRGCRRSLPRHSSWSRLSMNLLPGPSPVMRRSCPRFAGLGYEPERGYSCDDSCPERWAAAFTRTMGPTGGRKAGLPRFVFALLPLLAPFVPSYLRNNIAVVAWLRTALTSATTLKNRRFVRRNFRR